MNAKNIHKDEKVLDGLIAIKRARQIETSKGFVVAYGSHARVLTGNKVHRDEASWEVYSMDSMLPNTSYNAYVVGSSDQFEVSSGFGYEKYLMPILGIELLPDFVSQIGKANYIVEKIGDENILFDFNLKHIFKVIKESEYILHLSADWDMNGAKVPNKGSYKSAITFLINYSNYIYSELKVVIAEPQIDPVSDGSIDLLWKEKNSQLLINFKSDSAKASYYGDHYGDEDAIKGKISTVDIKEYLAVWMKNLSI